MCVIIHCVAGFGAAGRHRHGSGVAWAFCHPPSGRQGGSGDKKQHSFHFLGAGRKEGEGGSLLVLRTHTACLQAVRGASGSSPGEEEAHQRKQPQCICLPRPHYWRLPEQDSHLHCENMNSQHASLSQEGSLGHFCIPIFH